MNKHKYDGWHALPGQRTFITKRAKFDSIIHSVNRAVSEADTPAEKVAIYDFALWVLGRQIAADGSVSLLSGQKISENRMYDISPLFPHVSDGRPEQRNMDISEFPVYIGPWKHTKIASSLCSTFAHGFRDEFKEFGGIYYPEINFGATIDGRHHSSWAVYLGKCVMPMDIIPLKPYFPLVKTDGAHYFYVDEYGEPRKEKVMDCRFAAMYRIAQIKWEKDYPETLGQEFLALHQTLQAQMHDRIASLPRDLARYEELIQFYEKEYQTYRTQAFVLRDQVTDLKKDIEQKDKTIAELAKQLASSPQNNP